MKSFDSLPKSIKKTLRYIKQDVDSIEKLEMLEKEILRFINVRKDELINKRK